MPAPAAPGGPYVSAGMPASLNTLWSRHMLHSGECAISHSSSNSLRCASSIASESGSIPCAS